MLKISTPTVLIIFGASYRNFSFFRKTNTRQFPFIADDGPISLEKFTTSRNICIENSFGVFTVLDLERGTGIQILAITGWLKQMY